MAIPTEFQRPLRIPEHVELGVAEPPVARAGEKGSWVLTFVLARPIADEENVLLYAHGRRNNRGAWGRLQTDDPSKEGHVSLRRASGDALLPIRVSDDGGTAVFTTPRSGLPAGERLIAEVSGATAPSISLPAKFILILAAPPGQDHAPTNLFGETLESIAGACLLPIVGSEAARLVVHAPSQAAGEVALLVRPEDARGNVASSDPGALDVRENGRVVTAKRAPVPGSACCLLTGIALPGEGAHRLEVENARGLKALSNPIRGERAASSRLLLWGMIHGHTEISDGAGSLDHYCTYMRDECGLDFGATGDHDHLSETSDAMWRLVQEKVARYNEPGRFTTFLGYEWAKWRRNGDGDRNVYYLNDGRPLYRSDDGCYPTPPDLFRALRDETALIIPHHPANIGNYCDWKDHEPEKERLVEIYSMWGNSERSVHEGNSLPTRAKDKAVRDSGEVPAGFVQRALALGWRVGFTAGGDDHQGHPGDQISASEAPWDYSAGLMAAWAAANTREAIWEALWNRRCYGTTGARMIVDFEMGGRPMGAECRLSERPEWAGARRLRVSVNGTAPIKSIEIVRNNEDVYAVEPGTLDAAFEWTDAQPLAEVNLPPARWCDRPFTFYYVRVTQSDGEMAWASPVWILT